MIDRCKSQLTLFWNVVSRAFILTPDYLPIIRTYGQIIVIPSSTDKGKCTYFAENAVALCR